jgi:hypothetical protein
MLLIYQLEYYSSRNSRKIAVAGYRSWSRSTAGVYKELRPLLPTLPVEGFKVPIIALVMLGIGSALGLRFRIFALLPVVLLGFFAFTAFGLAQGTAIGSIMLTNVVGATCLQIGYLASALLKFLISSSRFGETRSSQSARPFAG